MNQGIYEKEFLFKKPFKNKCFGVLCMDDGSLGNHGSAVIVIVDANLTTKMVLLQ